ncbi:hypothetical protein [Bradyrhizobium sp.]|jgi:hypothetical protein|uniref:hypothetical protein n=1 Tax=Bradyrhizobium sp. TaxID=376 RepID=UPI003C1A24DF
MRRSSAKDDGAKVEFLDYTIAVWQPYSARPLTREDAQEIPHNVAGFFRILQEWAYEERRATAWALAQSPARINVGDVSAPPSRADARQLAPNVQYGPHAAMLKLARALPLNGQKPTSPFCKWCLTLP